MINKMKRIPICIMSTMVITIMFFFVDYTWIAESLMRAMYCCAIVIVGGITTAINADTKFWVYEKP